MTLESIQGDNVTEHFLKVLHGYSNSNIILMQNQKETFVRKCGDVQRNLHQLKILETLRLPTPKILNQSSDSYDMEYIPHQDTATWLIRNNSNVMISFIVGVLETFQKKSTEFKNYTETYELKLRWLDSAEIQLPFSKSELINRLPAVLPKSYYHGDFTMENILCNDVKFTLIDPLQSEYDSWVFDLSKLRQDLECFWFVRKTSHGLHGKLETILLALKKHFPHDYFTAELLILMLLRIYPYSKNTEDKQWLLKEIQRLWK
jgi:hypothetical protein